MKHFSISLTACIGLLATTYAAPAPAPNDVNVLISVKLNNNKPHITHSSQKKMKSRTSHEMTTMKVCWTACFPAEPHCPPPFLSPSPKE
ncbi:hypothetical protein BDZ45DRAFT_678904 [Acephala macrosclerotiorum]|nr:hypothetical protein BDZ45DRAFT_678904 [Acephala macrosclerotiorum]